MSITCVYVPLKKKRRRKKKAKKGRREKAIQGDPIHHCDFQVSP